MVLWVGSILVGSSWWDGGNLRGSFAGDGGGACGCPGELIQICVRLPRDWRVGRAAHIVVVVVVGGMLRYEEQKGLALFSFKTSMILTIWEQKEGGFLDCNHGHGHGQWLGWRPPRWLLGPIVWCRNWDAYLDIQVQNVQYYDGKWMNRRTIIDKHMNKHFT